MVGIFDKLSRCILVATTLSDTRSFNEGLGRQLVFFTGSCGHDALIEEIVSLVESQYVMWSERIDGSRSTSEQDGMGNALGKNHFCEGPFFLRGFFASREYASPSLNRFSVWAREARATSTSA